jgi:hypothetical protein
MADNASGVGTGLIAGILVAVVIGVGLLLVATGGFDFDGKKDVNVNVELPKAPEVPKAPSPGG